MPVDLTRGVNPDLVGSTADIVGTLPILVAIGYNPFPALLEVEQGFAKSMARSGRVNLKHASFYIDAFNVVVLLGFLDGGDDVVETHLPVSFAHQFGEDVTLASLVNHAAEREHQYGVVFYGGFSVGRCNHPDDRNDSKESNDSNENCNAYNCGKHIFEKILHSIFTVNIKNQYKLRAQS